MKKEMPPFPGELKRGIHGRIDLDYQQTKWLRRVYPYYRNADVYHAMGVTDMTLRKLVRANDLKKSTTYKDQLRKQQARDCKKLFTENGMYDQRRGQAPCETCQKARNRYLQEVQDGKRDAGVVVFRKKHPRLYKKMIEHTAQERRETFRKEKLRKLYGEKQQTKFHLPMQNYTRKQTQRRNYALRLGYFLDADCSDDGGNRYKVFYDKDTKRSKRFEDGLKAVGLQVLPESEFERDAPLKGRAQNRTKAMPISDRDRMWG